MFFFIDEPDSEYAQDKTELPGKKDSLQSRNGKAFEFATLLAIYQQLAGNQPVDVKKTEALRIAERSYFSLGAALKSQMDRAANAAVRVLLRLEPQLQNHCGNSPLHLCVQKDSEGIAGDVRDILTIRMQNGWEIGLSCKHNHSAVKHSRLSKRLDFGNVWFGVPCSSEYFNEISSLFDMLSGLKQQNALWKDLPDKEELCYRPLLTAFMNELGRLFAVHGSIIPERLLQYLLGSHDFYKVVTSDSDQLTTIQAFNLHGTLNRSAGKIQPQQKIPRLALPAKIYNLDFKTGSGNTIEVACSDGWTVKMRIHNASSKVEPSLKFDVSLEGHPATLYSQREPW